MTTTAIFGGVPAHWKQVSTRGLIIAFVSACVVFRLFCAVLDYVWQEFGSFDWDNPAGEPAQHETTEIGKE
jgi:hypothetical protein